MCRNAAPAGETIVKIAFAALLCLGVSTPALARIAPALPYDAVHLGGDADAVTAPAPRDIAKPAKPKKPVAIRRSGDEDRPPETPLEIARELGISGDDSRPDQQLQTRFLGKPLIVGGEFGAGSRYRSNYELVRGSDDDDLSFDPEAKLEAIWLPGENTAVFATAKFFAETTPYKQGGKGEAAAGAELSEAWLLRTGLFGTPLALQVGRQQVQDRREWWWDEDLDAVRLHYFGRKVRAYAGIGREFGHKSTLGRLEPEDRGIIRAFGNVRWTWTDRNDVELYGLHQNDRSRRHAVGSLVASDKTDESDAKLTWIGLRARGRVKTKIPGKFYYWADLARVRGVDRLTDYGTFDDTNEVVRGTARRKVRGWALDVGASLELPLKFEPYLTVGYARGSGDRNRGSGTNRAFRQTGLHNNNGKFRGLSRFRYYGEVLRPELSNLAVTTLALGLPLGKDNWIEAVWHGYRQPVASDSIAGSRLDADPDGVHRKLGQEIDVIFSHRPETSPWEFELTAGAFRAGPAFGAEQGRWAGLVEAKLDYNF
jgi:alginate production protein